MTIVLGAVAALVAMWLITGVVTILVGQWALRRRLGGIERGLCVAFTMPALSALYRLAEKIIHEGHYLLFGAG